VAADCAGTSLPRVDPDGKVGVGSLERFQKELFAWGITREAVDVKSHVNTEFTDAAVAKLAPYQP
jgi:hypothetical protein